MTKVKITQQNNSIVQIECDGHTGYGVEGEDIVCAGLSSIVQTALLGILQVAQVNVAITKDDNRGYIKAVLPKKMDDKQKHDCDVIFNTMMLGIADLHEGFSDFVEMEVNHVY